MRSTTVDATDDYLRWASSHCTRTSATAEGNLPCAPIRPNPNRHSTTRGGHTWVRAQSGSHRYLIDRLRRESGVAEGRSQESRMYSGLGFECPCGGV